ncbi:MAG: DNA modification methylase, partial [Bacteroidales bacterium]|nr:DNA modification methylase [Bacteroidales bacterium]
MKVNKITNIIIDPEFRDLIPALSTEEFRGLEKTIIKDGLREPIVLWNNIIVDGHNRYKICNDNKIKIKTIDYSSHYRTREEVIDWMITNQLSRRNLSPDRTSYLRGEQYERRKKLKSNPNGANQYTKEVERQNDVKPNVPTAEMVAVEQKVAPRTVDRDAAYNRDLKKIARGADSMFLSSKNISQGDLISKFIDGELKSTRTDIKRLSSMDKDAQKSIVEKIIMSPDIALKDFLEQYSKNKRIKERNEAIEEIKSKPENEYYKNADCVEYLKSISDNTIDLVLTDPPYEISRETGFANMGENGVQRFGVSMDFGKWDEEGSVDIEKVIKEFFRVLKRGGTVIIFYDLWKITSMRKIMEGAGFKQIRFIEWIKTNPVPLNSKVNYLTNAREIALVGTKGAKPKFHSEYDDGVYKYPIYHSKHRFHPTQKPVELMCDIINKHSDIGDIILDVFLGSGTTAVASIKRNRICKGCEIDPIMYKKMIG